MRGNDAVTILCPPGPDTEAIRARLGRELSRYRVPADVAKRIGKKSAEQITEPFLIVICTPQTPEDPAINREIDRFIGLGLRANILTLLYSDRPDLSFPRQLTTEVRPDGTVAVHEPLAANIFAASSRESFRKMKVEKLRLLAPMLGVAFDDLRNRRRRARNRVLAAIGAGVLAGGSLFLGTALTRKSTLNTQNRELNTLFTQAEEAREEAKAQQARAQEEYIKTLALSARRDMDQGSAETALTRCLFCLPDGINVPEMADTFEYVLEKYCAEGYIPIGSAYDYRLSRALGSEQTDAYHKSDGPWAGEKDAGILVSPPDETDTAGKKLKLKICARSASGQTSAYTDGDLIWISFLSQPGRDHYLRDDAGSLVTCDGLCKTVRNGHVQYYYACCFADDDTLVFLKDHALWAADILSGRVERLTGESREPDYRLLLSWPGTDVFFVFRESSAEIWKREGPEYLESIDGLEDIVVRGTADVFLGWQSGRLSVFGKNPFRYLFSIERDDGSTENALGTETDTLYLSDGRGALMYRYMLYDLKDGTPIADYRDESTQPPKTSSEGYVLTTGYQSVCIFDPVTGEKLKTIRACLSDRLNDTPDFQPYGPMDPATGRRSVSAVLIGSRVYEYRPGRALPPGMDGRIALAEDILGAHGRLPAYVALPAD